MVIDIPDFTVPNRVGYAFLTPRAATPIPYSIQFSKQARHNP